MINLILLLWAITSDSFVTMMEKGAGLSKIKLKESITYSLIFSFIAFVTVSIGYYLGISLIGGLEKLHQFNTILVLFIISGWIFFNVYRKKDYVEHHDNSFNYKKCFRYAFLTCIDVFVFGELLYVMGYSYIDVASLTALVTFIQSFIALYVGYYFDAAFQRIIGVSAGLIYFIIANVYLYKFIMMW